MLDVLDGRAKAINDDVLESIDMGLKALRGGGDKDAGNSKHTNKKSDSSIKKEKGRYVNNLKVTFVKVFSFSLK